MEEHEGRLFSVLTNGWHCLKPCFEANITISLRILNRFEKVNMHKPNTSLTHGGLITNAWFVFSLLVALSPSSLPTVHRQSVNCWPTDISQLLADTLGDTVGSNSIPCSFLSANDSSACANYVFTILVLRASLIVVTFILSSHLVIVIAVLLKKKIEITVMNYMCLPAIINVGRRTGLHGGMLFLTMSIALYLLQISKQMVTMSLHSCSQSPLNCCHTHPQSLFGYSHSCAG